MRRTCTEECFKGVITLPFIYSLPANCGALSSIEDTPLEIGQEVTAKVGGDWILAIVSRLEKDNRCVVEDIIEDAHGKFPYGV